MSDIQKLCSNCGTIMDTLTGGYYCRICKRYESSFIVQTSMFPEPKTKTKPLKYPTVTCLNCGQKVPARYGYRVAYACYKCGNHWEVND